MAQPAGTHRGRPTLLAAMPSGRRRAAVVPRAAETTMPTTNAAAAVAGAVIAGAPAGGSPSSMRPELRAESRETDGDQQQRRAQHPGRPLVGQ